MLHYKWFKFNGSLYAIKYPVSRRPSVRQYVHLFLLGKIWQQPMVIMKLLSIATFILCVILLEDTCLLPVCKVTIIFT